MEATPTCPATSSTPSRLALSVTDEALAVNSGDVPVTLRLYAADAATAINGGTGFANDGDEKNGAARWLSLPMSQLYLEPGGRRSSPSSSACHLMPRPVSTWLAWSWKPSPGRARGRWKRRAVHGEHSPARGSGGAHRRAWPPHHRVRNHRGVFEAARQGTGCDLRDHGAQYGQRLRAGSGLPGDRGPGRHTPRLHPHGHGHGPGRRCHAIPGDPPVPLPMAAICSAQSSSTRREKRRPGRDGARRETRRARSWV